MEETNTYKIIFLYKNINIIDNNKTISQSTLNLIIITKFKGLIQWFLLCPYYKLTLFQNHYLLLAALFISVYCAMYVFIFLPH